MNTENKRQNHYSEEQRKQILSGIVRKMGGIRYPKMSWKKAQREYWSENHANIPYFEFEHDIHIHPKKGKTTNNKPAQIGIGFESMNKPNTLTKLETNHCFKYIDLYRYLADNYGFLPSNKIGDAIGEYFGFAQRIALHTIQKLGVKGYKILKCEDETFKVISYPPPPKTQEKQPTPVPIPEPQSINTPPSAKKTIEELLTELIVAVKEQKI